MVSPLCVDTAVFFSKRPLGRKLDGWEHPGEHGEYGAARHAVCLGQLAKRDVPPRVLLNQALLLAGQRAKPALLHENHLRCVLCVTLRRPVPTLCISPARVGNADPSVAFGDSSPFRSAIGCAVMPLLKGEVPAMQAVGFISAEFGKSNLCFPNSSPEPAAATGCRPCRPAATGCRLSLPGGQTSEGVWGSAKRSGASPSRGGRRLPDNPQGILRIRRPWLLQCMAANGRQ